MSLSQTILFYHKTGLMQILNGNCLTNLENILDKIIINVAK